MIDNTTANSSNSGSLNECMCSDMIMGDYSPAYAWYNFFVVIILLPAVACFGVFSNIVNILVYNKPSMMTSGNTYLGALGFSDFFVVITGMGAFWIDSARSYFSELKYVPYMIVYTLPFGYAAQTCSVYFTVAAAVDCYVSVCLKSLCLQWCTVRRAKWVIALIVGGSSAYNLLRFGQFKLRHCMPRLQNVSIIEICPTDMFFKINTVYNVYMYMVLMTFLPFLLLSILNALILNQMRSSQVSSKQTSIIGCRNKKSSSPMVGFELINNCAVGPQRRLRPLRQASQSGNPSSDDTITMIMVVVMFLACNTLALVVNIVETFMETSPIALNFMTDTSNFLVLFNSSVNFIIYMIFSKQYRQQFCDSFCGPYQKKLRAAKFLINANSNHVCTDFSYGDTQSCRDRNCVNIIENLYIADSPTCCEHVQPPPPLRTDAPPMRSQSYSEKKLRKETTKKLSIDLRYENVDRFGIRSQKHYRLMASIKNDENVLRADIV